MSEVKETKHTFEVFKKFETGLMTATYQKFLVFSKTCTCDAAILQKLLQNCCFVLENAIYFAEFLFSWSLARTCATENRIPGSNNTF